MDQIKIGQYIREKRHEQHLTQAQLAEKLNVSNKSISRWENGKTFPDLSLYQPLCDALEISISELLHAEDLTLEQFEEQTNKLIVRLLFSKKQLFLFNFLLSIIMGLGIGLITYSFSASLDVMQKIVFIASGLILQITVTFLRILVIDKMVVR